LHRSSGFPPHTSLRITICHKGHTTLPAFRQLECATKEEGENGMQKIPGPGVANEDLIKKLAEAEAPCISIVLPVTAEADLRPQIRNAVREIRRSFENDGSDFAGFDLNALLAPIVEAGNEGVPPSQREAGTWVGLRSPAILETFVTPALFQ